MVKIKTADLIDKALDWAVATCLPKAPGTRGIAIIRSEHDDRHHPFCIGILGQVLYMHTPSTDPSQGQPILEREQIGTAPPLDDGRGWAAAKRDTVFSYGPTMLVAGLRCFVASKLGDEVEVPEELLPGFDTNARKEP